ncbi:MAG: class I SAM-dependent methyltransferase [Lachnospiraceae bacterium]|nr:class I SAM-dependent methyltransferase [Lachnospiraceae bacterium]
MNISLISEKYKNDGVATLELSELQKRHIKKFTDKCFSGEYAFRMRECECGHGDFEVIAQKDRYGIAMDTVICKNCGLIMTNPCMDDRSNNSFYDIDYPYIYRAEEKPSESVFLQAKEEAEYIIRFIQKHTGKRDGSVLEIGCADGRNVAAFVEAGYEATGIDLSHTYVDFGKCKGLNLICTDAASFAEGGNQFDIVVVNHVLEHFTDLARELNTIRSLLKSEGYLFVAVPGVKALALGAYQGKFLLMLQNAHIFNFTKDTLCWVMKKYGFDQVYCNEWVCGIFRKGESENGFGNQYYDTISFLKKTEDANGDLNKLLCNRADEIVGMYGEGEVILYGTAAELDIFVQRITDLSKIRGFFYTDKKTISQVIDYALATDDIKCIFMADASKNEKLISELDELKYDKGVNVFSAYCELF